MTVITKLSKTELLNDRAESLADIKVCELALLHGHTTYSGGSVQERLDTNQRIVEVIDRELERRTLAEETPR